MRIMGLDVGSKTIGVALSDGMLLTAQAHEVIRRTSLERDLKRITELCSEFECGRIVVGMPRNMNGTYGPAADSVRGFIAELSKVTGLPIIESDERMTTVMAQQTLIQGNVRRERRREVVDKVAAAVILQGFLDGLSNGRNGLG